MRSDSKSGLQIYEIIITLCVFIIVVSNIPLASNTKNMEQNNNKEQNIENTVIEDTKKVISTTARSGIKRSEKEVEYIKKEDVKISKNMDLSQKCGLSKEDFKELIKNLNKDKSGFFKKNSDLIYDLCSKYEINEIFFCGLIAGESGWNIEKNHREKCNYISMMYKGKLIKYKNTKEGLEAAAKLLHNKYLKEDGVYYNGKTLEGIQKMYCPDSSEWVDLIYSCMEQII